MSTTVSSSACALTARRLSALLVLAGGVWLLALTAGGCSVLGGCPPFGGDGCPSASLSCVDEGRQRHCSEDACGQAHWVENECRPDKVCASRMCEAITNWNGGVVCEGRELSFGPAQGERFRLDDVTGDGLPDVVLASSDGLLVARGSADGGFEEPESFDDGAGSFELLDLNGDAVAEIVAVPKEAAVLRVWMADRSGVLRASALEVEATPSALVIGADLQGTGRQDIVGVDGARLFAVLDPLGAAVVVESTLPVAPTGLTELRRFEDDRSGVLLIEGTELVGMWLDDGQQWQRSVLLVGDEGQHSALNVDLNQNGTDDVVLLALRDRALVLLDVTSAGAAEVRRFIVELGPDPELASSAAADLNADGDPDLVVLRADGNLVRAVGNGKGDFKADSVGSTGLAAVRWVGDGNGLALGSARDGTLEAFISSVPNPQRNRTRLNPSAPRIVVTTDGCLRKAAEPT